MNLPDLNLYSWLKRDRAKIYLYFVVYIIHNGIIKPCKCFKYLFDNNSSENKKKEIYQFKFIFDNYNIRITNNINYKINNNNLNNNVIS